MKYKSMKLSQKRNDQNNHFTQFFI